MSRFGYSLVVAIGLRGALSSSGEGTAGKSSGPVFMDRLSRGCQMGSQRFDPNEIVEQVGANDQQVGKGSVCCFRPVSCVSYGVSDLSVELADPFPKPVASVRHVSGPPHAAVRLIVCGGDATTTNRRLSSWFRVWGSFDCHILLHTPCFRPPVSDPCFRPLGFNIFCVTE